MSTPHYYPRIRSLVGPEEVTLGPFDFTELIEKLVNDVYYKEYQSKLSPSGDAAFYSLSLVVDKEVALRIPGTQGLALVFNPDPVVNALTTIPIGMSYRWPVRRFLGSFRFSNFGGSPRELFDILLSMLELTAEEVVADILEEFFQTSDPLADLVQVVNTRFNPGSPIVKASNPSLGELYDFVLQLQERGIDIFEVLYSEFLQDANAATSWVNIKNLFGKWLGPFSKDDLIALLVPRFKVSINSIKLALDISRSVLQPLDQTGQPKPDPARSRIIFDFGVMNFSSDGGLRFGGERSVSFTSSQIGNTGLSIGFSQLKLDLSRIENIAEADAAGYAPDFMGVFIQEATIGLPKKWFKNQSGSAEIFAETMLVGTGGITAKLGLRATGNDPNPELVFRLGGSDSKLRIGFKQFDLAFHLNAVVSSNIDGFLEIPGFKDAAGNKPAKIDIKAHFGQDGDFSITAKEADGIKLSFPKVFDLTIKSLTVGRQDDRLFLAIAGKLDFTIQLGVLKDRLPKGVEIQKLLIRDDGTMEFEGGGITLKRPFTFDVKPVKATISGMSFGSHQQNDRDYRFFGFDLDLSIKPGGVALQSNGIQLFFTVDQGQFDAFMRIGGVGIDMILPGGAKPDEAALLLSGFLSVKQPPQNAPEVGNEYTGTVSYVLPKLNMYGSASMRYNPKLPAFFMEIGLTLSTPLLLGNTNLGIFDFFAMLGIGYVANKKAAGLEDDAEWWRYYKAKVPPENLVGVQPGKFEQIKGFSIGAGVGLGTVHDSGFTFSAKALFLLSLPEVFILQGQAQIMAERIGLHSKKEPPFYIFIAISKKSVEAAIGVNYLVPDEGGNAGKIARVDGLLELGFFFGNSGAWRIMLGCDQPEDRRIQVQLLTLFKAYFYMMLSSSGIRAGAGASFELKKKFGPLRAELTAYFHVAGRISFQPKQIGASIQLGGSVGLRIFRFGFTISAAASLAAEAPKPFMIAGSVKACVRVMRKKRCAKFSFTWNFNRHLDTTPIPLLDGDASKAAKAVNVATGETFELAAKNGSNIPAPSNWNGIDDHVIAPDSFIDLSFKEGIYYPGSEFGGRTHTPLYTRYVPPQQGKSHRVRHELHATSIEVLFWDGQGWKPYDIYEAMTPLDAQPLPTGLFQGYWQMDKPGNYSKLRILSQTPFSYLTQNPGNGVVEDLGISTETVFCAEEPREKTCFAPMDFAVTERGRLPRVPPDRTWAVAGAMVRYLGKDGEIVDRPHQDLDKPLGLLTGERVEIYFNEPVACITLVMTTIAAKLSVAFDRRIERPEPDSGGMPVFEYQQLLSRDYTAKELEQPVTYEDTEAPIQRVTITAGPCGGRPAGSGDTEAALSRRSAAALADLPDVVRVTAHRQIGPFLNLYHAGRDAFFNDVIGVDSPDRLFCVGGRDDAGWLVKMNRRGDVLWEKSYVATGRKIFFRNGLTCPDGDFMLYGNLFLERRNQHLVVRVSQDGQLRWAQAYGHAAVRFTHGLVAARRDSYIFGGWHDSGGGLDNVDLVKIDGGGNVLASRQIGTGVDDQLNDIIPHRDGCIIMGATNQGRTWGGFVAALDANLDFRFKWKVRAGSFTYVDSALELPDGRLLIAGPTSSPGKPRESESFVGFMDPYEMKGPSKFLTVEVRDLLPGQTENGGHILVSSGKEFHLVTRASSSPRRASIAFLTGDLKLVYNAELDLGGNYGLSQLKTGLESRPELWACGNLRGGEGRAAWLTKTDRNFNNCRKRAIKRSKTIQGRLAIEEWKTANEGLAVKSVPLSLRASERRSSKKVLCPAVCNASDPSSFLYQVCYLTRDDAQQNLNIPDDTAVSDDNSRMVDGLENTVQPTWRLNTYFAIRVKTEDRLTAGGSQLATHKKDTVFGFKTEGGIGHFHQHRHEYKELEQNGLEDQFKLADLKHYIDYRRSYPNADSLRTNSKPLFYKQPELLLFFRQPYVYSMFNDWKSYRGLPAVEASMQVLIKDPAEDPSNPNTIELQPHWEARDLPPGFEPEDVRILNNLMTNGNPCTPVAAVKPKESVAVIKPPDLLPSKAYNAIFNAVMKKPSDSQARINEVHRCLFTTSIYPDFHEQVGSYRLEEEMIDDEGNPFTVTREAIFEVDRPFGAGRIAFAAAILGGSETDDRKLQYAHRFDRLIDGALGLGDLFPPVTTEINIIRDGGRVLGVLVRNPESFNPPETTPDKLNSSIRIKGLPDFQALFSKDASQAFITGGSNPLNVTPGRYELVFEYLQFNGLEYDIEASVDAVFFDITSPKGGQSSHQSTRSASE